MGRTILTKGQRDGLRLQDQNRERTRRTGLSSNGHTAWTQRENRIVQETYPDYAKMADLLPHRTRVALHHQAQELGLPKLLGLKKIPVSDELLLRYRRLYRSAIDAQTLRALIAPRTLHQLHMIAARRGWRRPAKPYKPTGFPEIDALQERCRENGYTLTDLDEWAQAGGYFYQRGWRRTKSYRAWLIRKANRILDAAH